MADYAKMYTELFRAATKAIKILQDAQQETEEIYISDDDPVLTLLSPDSDDENRDGGHT